MMVDTPTRPRPRARKNEESLHQQALIDWARMASIPSGIPGVQPGAKVADYLFAVPNGGGRTKAQAGILKAEGTKAGVWDLQLPVPIGRTPGLWIEMKAGKNTLSEEQRTWRTKMEALGFKCVVCWSWDAARAAIEQYLAQAPRPAGILAALDDAEEGELAHEKDKPVRSPKYLRAVAGLPCINCGREGASQAAHINRGKGMSMKAGDNKTFPLCAAGTWGEGCHIAYDQYRLGDKHQSAEMGERWATSTFNTLKRAKQVPMGVPAPKFDHRRPHD